MVELVDFIEVNLATTDHHTATNPTSLTRLTISFLVAVAFKFVAEPLGFMEALEQAGWLTVMAYSGWKLVLGIAITTVGWLLVTFLTPPEEMSVLADFCVKIRAGGPGWRKVESWAAAQGRGVVREGERSALPLGLLCMVLGCAAVWSMLFGLGFALYGKWSFAAMLGAVVVVASVWLLRLVPKIRFG